jgi:4-oxalocrotonate tautomerase
MPIIEIKLWEGRSREQKEAMAKRITDAVVEEGKTAAENVHIIFSDYARSDWAIAGRLQDQE